MTGLKAGLSQVCFDRSIGRSPSVVCRRIARHRRPGGVYQARGRLESGTGRQAPPQDNADRAWHEPALRVVDEQETPNGRFLATRCWRELDRLSLPQHGRSKTTGQTGTCDLIHRTWWGQCVRDPGRAHHPLTDSRWPCLSGAGPTRSARRRV